MADLPPNPSAEFAALLSRFPPAMVALANKILPKLRRAFPGSYELVYDYGKSIVVSYSMTERGYEAIVAVAIFADSFKLYFDKSLPDPKGLLSGAGAKVRSVALESASDFANPDIQALLAAAIERSGVDFPRSGATRMVFKSEAKKRKSK
jgi:hypothetical protein